MTKASRRQVVQLLPVILVILILACSGSDEVPTPVAPDTVTLDELRALVPEELLPPAFRRAEEDQGLQPVASSQGLSPYFGILFSDERGSEIGFQFRVTGREAPLKAAGQGCGAFTGRDSPECDWKEGSSSLGDDSRSTVSSSPTGQHSRMDVFSRNGIVAMVGILTRDENLLDLAPTLLEEIDARLEQLINAKIERR